jgi:hypothetical protein
VAGLTLQAVGFMWIALIAKAGVDDWDMVPPLVIAGAGISMAIPAATPRRPPSATGSGP